MSIENHFPDILAQVITNRAQDDVAFLEQQAWCIKFRTCLGNGCPDLDQIVKVPLQFFRSTTDAGSTDNDAHAVGNLQCVHCLAQFGTLVTFDAAGNTTGTWTVGHEHQITTSKADHGGERCTFVAAFFFFNLDDNFGALGNHVTDVDAAMFGNILAEVFAGDFFEGQEAVTISAEIYKRSLKAWFDTSDATFVDIGFFLDAIAIFDVQIKQTLAINQGDAQLFFLSCIY